MPSTDPGGILSRFWPRRPGQPRDRARVCWLGCRQLSGVIAARTIVVTIGVQDGLISLGCDETPVSQTESAVTTVRIVSGIDHATIRPSRLGPSVRGWRRSHTYPPELAGLRLHCNQLRRTARRSRSMTSRSTSACRSESTTRTRAMRTRPEPSREVSSRTTSAWSRTPPRRGTATSQATP